MALDVKLILAYTLAALYTISSKLVDAWLYYSILTLIEGLRPFQKYWIIVNLILALAASNSTEIDKSC